MVMNNNSKKMISNYLIALIPAFVFGLYKNAFLLYSKNVINFISVFKPIFIIIFSLSISILINYLFVKDKKKFDFFDDISILDSILIAMLMPPRINLIYYCLFLAIFLTVSKLLFNLIKFNRIAFIKLSFYFLFIFLFKNNYLNSYEGTTDFAISILDLFIGKGIGGILSTSCLGLIIGYIFLSTNFSYKKEIPLYICFSFLLIMFIYGIMHNDILFAIKGIMNNSIMFAAIFIAPETLSSPYTKKGKGFYGIIIGMLSAIMTIKFKFSASIFLIIFFMSLISPFLDSIFFKKLKKEL